MTDEEARQRMDDLGNGFNGDTEVWHSMADNFLLECLGEPLSPETVDVIRAWWRNGEKWYALAFLCLWIIMALCDEEGMDV